MIEARKFATAQECIQACADARRRLWSPANAVIEQERPTKAAKRDPDEIGEIVRDVLTSHPGVSVAAVKGRDLSADVKRARSLAMYEVRRRRPDISFPAIGKWFGGRHHSGVMASIKLVERGVK
jgi:chromosomal replication initiation ATPase DnaA